MARRVAAGLAKRTRGGSRPGGRWLELGCCLRVIFNVSLLDSWLLLDGHDRLLAARLEGVEPTMLALSSVREVPVELDAGAQERLRAQLEARFGALGLLPERTTAALDAVFRGMFPAASTMSRTHAWPIAGGAGTWQVEVEARLRAVKAIGPAARLAAVGPDPGRPRPSPRSPW